MSDFTDSERKDAKSLKPSAAEMALIVAIFAACIFSAAWFLYWAVRAWIPIVLAWSQS